MTLGSRSQERFWIAVTVRFAFGFMFLIAAINIFFHQWDSTASVIGNVGKIPENLKAFAEIQTKGYADTWLDIKFPYGAVNPQTGATDSAVEVTMTVMRGFVMAMPVVFIFLAAFLLSGFMFRAALRFSAIYLVMLGLGKYVTDFKTGVTPTTLQDFVYAMFITLALFVLSKEEAPARAEVEEREEVAVR
jgi:hypothetical protein